ncbi:unnamed protein product [Caenorhabditis angaria]|uniref:Major facilitator superfamily (MFS) profile domain-containing protein n=1 Tax=Caenorhabditis angaria TaxID=860376 RepID=A0A9P1IY81_9PELO|nr:unnamed protein product [Caenorhabditis angaria]
MVRIDVEEKGKEEIREHIICMKDIVEEHVSTNQTGTHWFDDPPKKSFVFSSMAVGGLVGLTISVPLMQVLGVRKIMTFCGVFSTLGSLFFPFAVNFSYYAVLACRFLQGLGVSLVFTVLGVIPVVWAPNNESSSFLAILSCAFQLSNVICMPISGFLCESSLGWRSIYYLFGTCTTVALNVSNLELSKIQENKVVTKKREPVPYLAVCTDICVLSAWLSNVGGNLGFLTLVLYGPTYLREVLHFEVKGTGFASALPFLLSALFKFIAGHLSDRCTFLSEKTRYMICACLSRGGLAIGYFAMATTSNRIVAQIAFTFAIAISGLNIMGTVKCLQLRCRQHCHFAVAAIALLSYITQFVTPISVAYLCPDNTVEQWGRYFLIISGIVFFTSLPFPFLTTAEPADYVKTKEEKAAVEIEN